jgi:branched-chain amino acid transport system permease protein
MGSLGLMMILSQGALLAFGTTEKGIPSIFPQVISVGNITLPVEKLVAIVACALIMIGLYFLFYKTRLGKSLRAVSFDVEASSLQGINTNRIYMVGFMLGCAITGIAGAILAPVYAINTGMGARVLFMALIAMLLGGIGSYKGAILGGFLVGVVLSFGYHFVEQLSTTLLFVIVMVILIFRPGGLLGKVVD